VKLELEPPQEPARRSPSRVRGERLTPSAANAPTPEPGNAAQPESAPPSTGNLAPGADIPSRKQRVGQGPIDTFDPYRN
jgi:hypothetical protein